MLEWQNASEYPVPLASIRSNSQLQQRGTPEQTIDCITTPGVVADR